jgi:hypothetical protein
VKTRQQAQGAVPRRIPDKDPAVRRGRDGDFTQHL